MVVEPMIRNNICMNAHPIGCKQMVAEQIDFVRSRPSISNGAKNVLIVGSSMGYGLASRIVATFGMQANTLGVAFERPAQGKRTASAGWYANQAFEVAAKAEGYTHDTIIADAFSHETKQQTIEQIRKTMGSIDLFIYSLASGIRIDPDTGERYTSVLKPIGSSYTAMTIDTTGTIKEMSAEAATEAEIEQTVKVMGGADWQLWTDALLEAGVMSKGTKVLAYSYIGPELTRSLYREGTIGRAKEDLEETATALNSKLKARIEGNAYVSVNKAVVTRASAVIPVVPLYLSILFKEMKKKSLHEGCIEQMYRMCADRLYSTVNLGDVKTDEKGRIRMDDWEMRDDIQAAITESWGKVSQDTIADLADIEQFSRDFLNIHGFGFESIDYSQDIAI